MTRHTNMIRQWKYKESKSDKSNNRNQETPPGERLVEAGKSDLQSPEHRPNITGWNVVETNRTKVGVVRDSLIDKDEMRERYLIVDLGQGELPEESKQVLIPVGQTRLDREKKEVKIPAVDKEKLSSLPVYRNTKSLARVDEEKTQQVFSTSSTGSGEKKTSANEDFYNHRDFHEDHFYSSEEENGK